MGRRIPFKDSGKHFITVFLTDEQVKEVVEKYPFYINRELAEEYCVSKDLICSIAFHYSLEKDKEVYSSIRGWKTNDKPVDLVMFDWFYPKTTNDQLREVFGKSDHFIRNLACERHLEKYEDVLSARHAKSRPRILFSISGTHYENDNITLEDVLYIVKNYPTQTNKYLSEKVGCKEGIIVSVSRYYELSKDETTVKERRKNILIERNKRLGRDVTPELIKQEALKYHSKREFYDRDPSLYATASRLGIMEEVTKHMLTIAFSIPQIITRQITEYLFNQKCEYNTRRIIAPYELDVYFPDLKIAFEYDGKGWHQNDEVDKIKLCEEKGIFLIKLFERSRRFKEDIQNYLLEKLEQINAWCGTEITEEQVLLFNEPIDFPKLFSEEELDILRKNTVTYLRKNHLNLYNRYRRYNPDNKTFPKVKWTEETVEKELKKYSSWNNLYLINPPLYQITMKKFKHLKEKLFPNGRK